MLHYQLVWSNILLVIPCFPALIVLTYLHNIEVACVIRLLSVSFSPSFFVFPQIPITSSKSGIATGAGMQGPQGLSVGLHLRNLALMPRVHGQGSEHTGSSSHMQENL